MKKVPDELYGLSVKYIAEFCKVDITTARRWKRGAICPPHTVLAALSGDLGFFDSAWAGWRVHKGQLISPEGWTATVGEVLALPLMRGQIRTYQVAFRNARKLSDVEEFPDAQPLPDEPIPLIREK